MASALLLLAASVPVPLATGEAAREIVRREVIDLRDLPAGSSLSAVTVALRAQRAVPASRLWVSVAINGTVVARRRLADTAVTTVRATIAPGLLSMGNAIEVAAYVPDCAQRACRAAAASVRMVGALRQEHGTAEVHDSFAHLATRYRGGVTIRREPGTDPRFAVLARQAIAPRAPLREGSGALIVVSRRSPRDHVVPIRFDLGPVALVRHDGAPVVAPSDLAALTVAQVVQRGDRPVIWVRPGRDVPATLDLSGGDVALFGRHGRILAYSSSSDAHVLRAQYAPGVDADGSARTARLWRWVLLVVWAGASIGLGIVYRRLPQRAGRPEAPAWAA